MKRRMILLAVLVAGVISYWPFPNAMSCWTAANDVNNKMATKDYINRNEKDFTGVNSYLVRSDYSLRNFGDLDGVRTFVYTTDYSNFSCWYLNIISVDGSIIRVDIVNMDGGYNNFVESVH